VVATAAPPSPKPSGTTVTITGTATCPSASPQYEFWYLGQGSSSWQLVQGWSTANTYSWNSTGALAGSHVFSVWARDATSTAAYDAYGNTTYTTTTPACASVTASAAPASPQPSGTTVTITGTPGTCSNAAPKYEFWYLGQGSSTWQMVQAWSTTATYSWNSTGALAGNHVFSIWIKDAASSAAYDAYGNTTYVTTTPSCASVSLAAAPPSPRAVGTGAVVFTATAGTCTNAAPKYQFWYRGQGSTTWQMVQDYSTSNTYSWNTAGALAGNHYWSVWIKDAASSGTNAALGSRYDAFGPLTYVLQ
jgi:hypothetical protein